MSPALGSSFAAALTAPEQLSPASFSSSSAASSSSGSSITSFDSNNLIDDKRLPPQPHLQQPVQHQHQQQQQQHSRIQAKDTAGPYPIPMQRPEHVENHLEATHSIDGADNVFGTPMYFGTENSTVVTTQIGATAHVPCTVHHIGEGVVSKHLDAAPLPLPSPGCDYL